MNERTVRKIIERDYPDWQKLKTDELVRLLNKIASENRYFNNGGLICRYRPERKSK